MVVGCGNGNWDVRTKSMDGSPNKMAYTPVHQHSHGKATILMVFNRKDGEFHWDMFVSGRGAMKINFPLKRLPAPSTNLFEAAEVKTPPLLRPISS